MQNNNKIPKQTMIIPAGASLDSKPVLYMRAHRSKRALVGNIIAITITVAFFGLAIWAIVTARSNIAERDKLIETGYRAEGTATGDFNMFDKKLGKYSRGPVYYAYYAYTKHDGTESRTYGDKEYKSPDDIKKGMKATIHYSDDPGSDTAVTDEE